MKQNFALGSSAQSSEVLAWCDTPQNTFLSLAVPHHTYGTLLKLFASHSWESLLHGIWSRPFFAVLPDSLLTCAAILVGLHSDLGTLCSCPARPTYFSQGWIKNFCVKFCNSHMRKEEVELCRMARSNRCTSNNNFFFHFSVRWLME